MLVSDYLLAHNIADYWKNPALPAPGHCVLLHNRDELIDYMDARGMLPGWAILPCPVCGGHHSWSFLRELMERALDQRPAGESPLLLRVSKKMEENKAFYGGEENYRKYLAGADAFIKNVASKPFKPKRPPTRPSEK